jgi:hypothetical protein
MRIVQRVMGLDIRGRMETRKENKYLEGTTELQGNMEAYSDLYTLIYGGFYQNERTSPENAFLLKLK